jgi:hypothetical protein
MNMNLKENLEDSSQARRYSTTSTIRTRTSYARECRAPLDRVAASSSKLEEEKDTPDRS